MKKRHILVGGLASISFGLLTGCVPMYQIKSSGPTAQLANNGSIFLFEDAKRCTHMRRMSDPVFVIKQTFTPIPANTLMTIGGTFEGTDSFCPSQVGSFIPKAGNQYQVTYLPSGGTFFKNGVCKLKVYNLTTKKNESVIVRNYNSGSAWSGHGAHCEDKLSN